MLVEHISNFCYAIYVFLMFSMLAECILNSRQVTSYQYRIYVTNMPFNVIMYLILTEHTLSYCEAMFFEYIRIGCCQNIINRSIAEKCLLNMEHV